MVFEYLPFIFIILTTILLLYLIFKRKGFVICFCLSLCLSGCITNSKEVKDMNEEDSLLQVVENSDIEAVHKLIEAGMDVNQQDDKGRTPTMIATYNNDLEMAKLLIESGADVNIQDDLQNTPFLYAGAEGYLDILNLTIKAGADPKIVNRYGGTALIPASEHCYVDVIKELLTETNIDVNHINDLGWTALMEAVILNNGSEKQQQTVQLLIDYGADVNITDQDGITPLEHARNKGFTEIERILEAKYTK